MKENEDHDAIQNEDVAKSTSRHLLTTVDPSLMPRERALRNGLKTLSDTELMAILLGTGTKGKNVLDLASEILFTHNGHLSELINKSPIEITKRFNGVGRSKALLLLAAIELGCRAAHDAALVQSSRKTLKTSQDGYELMRHKLQNLNHEEFWILLLNNGLKRIVDIKISEGATNFTIVEVKNVIKTMMAYDANNVILFHNHPSGTLQPSAQDDALTRKIKEATSLFDFKVIDHIIISASGYYSYSDNGRL